MCGITGIYHFGNERAVDRDLLEGDCRLEGGVVRRQQPVDHRLLMLFDAPDHRERWL